jgi:hypothetical protein
MKGSNRCRYFTVVHGLLSTNTFILKLKRPCNYTRLVYSERQKYGINSLKIKQNFFQKNLWTGQF